jgi:two-component system, cell cycle response regulator
MYESALRDGLTKAFNKKYFTDRLESEFTFAIRHQSPLVLVMFDIDHFKKVNDTYGHQAGDLVLSELSTLLTAALRAEDVFARYGGEEFAVICRGTDLTQAQIVGDRMRKAVEGHRFTFEGTHIPVTISVGIAGLPDDTVKDATDLVARADKALYQSKHGGRNRVTIHGS